MLSTEGEDRDAALLGEPDLAFPICSDVDLCINFLMSVLLLCEFRLEEDLGGKMSLTRGQKTSAVDLPEKESRQWSTDLLCVSCNLPP